jgi:hypothetical protein
MAYGKTKKSKKAHPAALTRPGDRPGRRVPMEEIERGRTFVPNREDQLPKVFTRNGGGQSLFDPDIVVSEVFDELDNEEYITSFDGSFSPETRAEIVIAGLGFDIVPDSDKMSKDFSLIGQKNSDETIMNKRILDPDLKLLTADPISCVEKFKDASDPFYEPDDERTSAIKKEKQLHKTKQRKKLLKVARSLSVVTRRSPNKMLNKRVERRAK